MLYFKMVDGKVAGVKSADYQCPMGCEQFSADIDSRCTDCSAHWASRHEIRDAEQAERMAQEATAVTGRLHIADDRGSSTWPRFDVVCAPKVGDIISKGFNGDYYPCGEIVSISETLKVIVSSNGERFYRRGKQASWVEAGTWYLVQGHHNERNPSF